MGCDVNITGLVKCGGFDVFVGDCRIPWGKESIYWSPKLSFEKGNVLFIFDGQGKIGILYINNSSIGLCVEILGWVLYLGFYDVEPFKVLLW